MYGSVRDKTEGCLLIMFIVCTVVVDAIDVFVCMTVEVLRLKATR